MKKIWLIAALLVVLAACNKISSVEQEMAVSLDMAAASPAAAEPPLYDMAVTARSATGNTSGRQVEIGANKIALQIIRNANLRFQVKDLAASHSRVAAMLKKYNAYFGNDNSNSNARELSSDVVIRVPAVNFDKLLAELEGESVYINYKNITAEDVTGEYMDLEARIKTHREIEQRYLVILKQAGKVTDMLEIEEKLGEVREKIEAAEGRIKLLQDRVAYSTVTVNMYQSLDYAPGPQIGFISNLKEAFANGWLSLVEFVLSLVRVWPFALLAVPVVVLIVRKIRARRKTT